MSFFEVTGLLALILLVIVSIGNHVAQSLRGIRGVTNILTLNKASM